MEAETLIIGIWNLEFYSYDQCEMRNDKRDSKTQEEKNSLAALRYSVRSLATGSAGFLFWQSNHLFVL